MSSAYWNSQYNYYLTNRPPAPESYYNKSFVDRINAAQKNIDNLVAEKDKSWAATGQKQDAYNAFEGTMSSYGDIYNNAENEFGVKHAEGTYEESKKALALAESTLSALPSSINSSSNRVLTQSQREARYNALSNRQVSYRDNLMARSSAYEEVWKNARENQAIYAKAEMASQYSKLGDYNNAFVMAMNEYDNASKRLTQAKITKMDWENQYRSWQHQQYQYANQVWKANLNTALSRYLEALNTEASIRQANARIASANARIASAKKSNTKKSNTKTWDFGGGLTLQGVVGKEASYYYNGKKITAGKFLEKTGAKGINWSIWNSIWSSGVKTSGVGSKTVSAFNMRSQRANWKYAYLF